MHGRIRWLVIYEAPDEATVAATVLSAVSPGHLKTIKTTVLLSVEDTMKAMNKANAEAYPGPKLWSPVPS
ncbi:MAG: GYD domain-containing protein [Actinomycetota bacterium]|nr:GYD domain-containing protein [Actinomycetota bacterium]